MIVETSNDQWIIVLDKGQKLMSTLTEIASEKNILGGHIVGIGALEKVELGAFHLDDKDYIRKTFDDAEYELISLNGNVTQKDGKPFIHAHSALGREDFTMFGGHLFEATVAVTAEIYVTPFGIMPERQFNEAIGLATIQHCPIKA